MTRWTLAAWVGGVCVCAGCTGQGLARLEQDIAALRERVQAREEVRINVAGPQPVTHVGSVQAGTEPHVSVGCPPTVVERVVERRERPRLKAKRGQGRR